jgi:hypothetical protein
MTWTSGLSELKQRANSAQPNHVLLLLDDVDQPMLLEPEQVRRLAQAEWLHIIATTRLDEYQLLGRKKDRVFLTLSELTEKEALTLIESYQPNSKFPDEATRDIAHETVGLIGRYALALEAAAVFLAQDVSCAAFRDRLKDQVLTEIEVSSGEPRGHTRRCRISLSVTLRCILEQMGGAERMTLGFAALLPADHVALPWVRVLVAHAYPELAQDALNNPLDPWQDLLQRLFRLRLLQATAGQHEVRMHRLIQDMLRLNGGAETIAPRERALMAHVIARAGFLWDGWVQHEHRWEFVPLIAFAWQWLRRGAR